MQTMKIRNIGLLLCVSSLFLAGCRSGLGPLGRRPALGLNTAIPGPTAAGGSGWVDAAKPFNGSGGQLTPISDRRWEGVAIYFAYDRATVGAAERGKLEALAAYLAEHPTYSVVVEGHADERGSDEYNRALSERRALAVVDYLVSLGVLRQRLDTLAYGEERPAVADARTEEEHARNRRAEFIIGIKR